MFKKIGAVILAAGCAFAVSAASPAVTMTGPDGKANQYKTIQAALDAASGKGEYTVKLPKGTYEEVLYYNGEATVVLSGDTKAEYGKDVVIAKANDGDIAAIKRAGTAQKARCLFEFEGTGNLVLENLTLHNTFERGSIEGSNTQAETLGFDSTGYVAAYNCAFKSHQDTLRTTGKAWFYNCFVSGDTDFIWMEQAGKVALFEECKILSVYDKNASNHTSYIGAPRMAISKRAGKGLVIYNSSIDSEKDQVTFLGRTPWTNGYYNQIAYVNVKAKGVSNGVWYQTPLTAEGIPQTVIGWKLDKATAKNLGVSADGRKDILSDNDVKTEFAGRKAILNRYYDLAAGKYKKDSGDVFDCDGLAKKRGWTVKADASKELLAGEKESVRVEYVLDKPVVDGLTCAGFEQESDKPHYQGKAGDSMSFKVAQPSIVTVQGYYAGNGTIKADKQGEAYYNMNNGSTAKFNEKVYVVYEPDSTVTITATAKSYITKITVDSDDGLKFIPVSKINVANEKKAVELKGRQALQMTAKLEPVNPSNVDYVWSVSDESAATIDENGVLTALAVSAEKEIVVKATSCDSNKTAGEMKIKILPPEAGAFIATWLDSPESSESLKGSSDDEKVAVAGKAKTSSGTWKFNSSKITPDLAKGSISYSGYSSPIKGKDKVYVEFPLTAKENIQISQINIAYGNHGTGNMAASVTYTIGKSKEAKVITEDTSRGIRSTKKEYKLLGSNKITVKKGETINIRVALYGYTGQEIDIPTGKAPTIATITVIGKQK